MASASARLFWLQSSSAVTILAFDFGEGGVAANLERMTYNLSLEIMSVLSVLV